jgi:excisionase family DNA binding protein
MTPQQVADCAQVSLRTVRRWIAEGELRVVRLGRSVRVHPNDFHSLLNQPTIRRKNK